MKFYFTLTLCFLGYTAITQENDAMKNEAKDVIKNFYSLLENIVDNSLDFNDKKSFKVEVLNHYCDKRKTIFVNNLNSRGSRHYSASEYLDNVISFFPFGASINFEILKITDPDLTEDLDKLHCMVEVRSNITNLETKSKFSSHLIYNIIFKQIGVGTYDEAIIISTEPYSQDKFDLSNQRSGEEEKEKENDSSPINPIDDNLDSGEELSSGGETPPSNMPVVSEEILLKTSNFRRCKGGHFTIGCQSGSVNCDQDERPAASVTLAPFAIQENEVTNGQYLEFIRDYGSDKVISGDYRGQLLLYTSTEGLQKVNNEWTCATQNMDKPIVDVTWYGAITFANHYGLDLPTEAQWEYAARSGNSTSTFQFAGSDNLFQYGFYESNSSYESSAVMQKMPNALNLYDMSGNVWEWCKNWYKKNAYSNITKNESLEKGSLKAVRGGGYANNEWECRVQNRWFKEPHLHTNDIGFRCVKNY